ncbi:hypothetical protein [Sphingomonas sp. KR3-1]|uniref:protein kinase domain-containing protein n=1 Tax=Sphingomonas sp. KR3-1 TaxID=3156611 RepID=UPI0032B53168
MRLYVQDRQGPRRPIAIDQAPLGQGGEGRIHAVRGDRTRVIKLYADPRPERRAKVEAMLACPLATPAGSAGSAGFAWPQGIVTDSLGAFRGFTMRRIDTAQYFALETLLIPAARAKAGLPGDGPTSYRFRVKVARNIAAVIAQAHRAGQAVVDIKPMNIFIHRVSAQVVIVDCDGCRINGPGGVFPAAVATEEYLAPEFHGKVHLADRRQDLFALAMVVFRLLNNDLYPMNGIPTDADAPASHAERIRANLLTVNPAAPIRQHAKSIQDMLPAELMQMFRNAFSHVQPLRPSAQHWADHLAKFEQSLTRCKRVRGHVALPAGCPWCIMADPAAASVIGTQGSARPRRRANWAAATARLLGIPVAILLCLGLAVALYAAPLAARDRSSWHGTAPAENRVEGGGDSGGVRRTPRLVSGHEH